MFEQPEGAQTIQEEPQYWQIPRGSVALDKLLELQGYEIRDEESYGTGYNFCRVVRIDLHTLLKFPLSKDDKGRDELDKPIIIYNTCNLSRQLDEALKLRDFLDQNNVQYEEEPPREIAARSLRETSQNLVSLADRIEGRKVE